MFAEKNRKKAPKSHSFRANTRQAVGAMKAKINDKSGLTKQKLVASTWVIGCGRWLAMHADLRVVQSQRILAVPRRT